jgi:glutathione S-transferase
VARLLTIPLSHYCERARWALDHAEVDYDERQHLQPFAWIATVQAGGRRTVPVFVVDDLVLADSADIVRWASARARAPLYPEGRQRAGIEAFEDELAGEFGVEARRFSYSWFFRALPFCEPFNAGCVSAGQRAAMRAVARLARPVFSRYLDLTPATAEAAAASVRRTMDRVADRLADGRPYLFGDRFTAADLTFASLAAICIGPREYGVAFPEVDAIPDEAGRDFLAEMRAHPAGRFVLRLYAERPAVRARYLRPPRVARAVTGA